MIQQYPSASSWWGGHGQSAGSNPGRYPRTNCFDTTLYVSYVDDTFASYNDSQYTSRILQIFHRAHPIIRFKMEGKHENMSHFLDLGIKGNSNGLLEGHIYWNDTWSEIYLNLHNSCTTNHKIALVRTLSNHVCRLCSVDRLKVELATVKLCLHEDCCRRKSICKCWSSRQMEMEYPTVKKKSFFLELRYKSDGIAGRNDFRLSA